MATTYTYDEEGQLLSESRGEETTSYTYDGNYNRLTKSVTGQPTEEYSYDDADRLLSVASSAGTKSFLYDNCGRTTEEKWNGTTVKTYAWNHDDRLVSATGSWGTRSYGYNGLGSRVSETGGQGRSWLRRGAGPTSAVLKDSVNRYSAGGTFRSLAGGTSTFMGGGHKSVDALLSSSQTLTGTVRRDAFGLTKEQTGTWNQPFGFGGNFGYQSDDDTGLQLLGNRYYDASAGRFLSRDPVKDGPNWYAYCLNDPVNQTDPTGKQEIDSVNSNGNWKILLEEIRAGDATSGVWQAARKYVYKFLEKHNIRAGAHAVKRIVERIDDLQDIIDILDFGGGYYDAENGTYGVYKGGKYKRGIALDSDGRVVTVLHKGQKPPRWQPVGRDVINKLLKRRARF